MSRVTLRSLCLLAALLLGTLGAVVSARPAAACDCAGPSLSRAVRTADAVFHGTLTSRTRVRRDGSDRVDLRFAVSGVYKGTVYADQVVASSATADGCGLDAPVGSTWTVLATEGIEGTGDRAVNRLITSLCHGDLAGDTVPAVLGRPERPIDGASDREERSERTDQRVTSGVHVAAYALLGLGVLVVAGLALAWRPGRPPP